MSEPAGEVDPRRITTLRAAQEAFLLGEGVSSGVRDLVADSWERSLAAGLDPERDRAPVQLTDGELADVRDQHPLSGVLGVVRELVAPVVDGGGVLVAVADAEGRLLWVDGDRHAMRRAEGMNFVPGAAWDERHAGTNAPGTAVATEQAVQIVAAEHFSRIVQSWTCSAAPVHDPATGELLGVVDLTGGPGSAHPANLALVKATARAAASELALARPGLWLPRGAEPVTAPLLAVLGRDEGLLSVNGKQRRLSRRHSEILTVLARHPDGMSGEQLGLELYGDEANPITLRAEMSRLRRLLPELLRSRPYRLAVALEADVCEVLRLLGHGEVRAALRRYPGPLLPLSEAPGIARVRRQVEQRLRVAVLASADPALLTIWTTAPHGADDLPAWEVLAQVAPYGSVRSLALARVAELSVELAVPAARRPPATYPQRSRS